MAQPSETEKMTITTLGVRTLEAKGQFREIECAPLQ